jgi:hypothetical protein
VLGGDVNFLKKKNSKGLNLDRDNKQEGGRNLIHLEIFA